jgi:hypothetical protein
MEAIVIRSERYGLGDFVCNRYLKSVRLIKSIGIPISKGAKYSGPKFNCSEFIWLLAAKFGPGLPAITAAKLKTYSFEQTM